MPPFEWHQSDRFISNDGKGPLHARILCVADGVLTMERWHSKNPRGQRRVRFKLPLVFFLSSQCGWQQKPDTAA